MIMKTNEIFNREIETNKILILSELDIHLLNGIISKPITYKDDGQHIYAGDLLGNNSKDSVYINTIIIKNDSALTHIFNTTVKENQVDYETRYKEIISLIEKRAKENNETVLIKPKYITINTTPNEEEIVAIYVSNKNNYHQIPTAYKRDIESNIIGVIINKILDIYIAHIAEKKTFPFSHNFINRENNQFVAKFLPEIITTTIDKKKFSYLDYFISKVEYSYTENSIYVNVIAQSEDMQGNKINNTEFGEKKYLDAGNIIELSKTKIYVEHIILNETLHILDCLGIDYEIQTIKTENIYQPVRGKITEKTIDSLYLMYNGFDDDVVAKIKSITKALDQLQVNYKTVDYKDKTIFDLLQYTNKPILFLQNIRHHFHHIFKKNDNGEEKQYHRHKNALQIAQDLSFKLNKKEININQLINEILLFDPYSQLLIVRSLLTHFDTDELTITKHISKKANIKCIQAIISQGLTTKEIKVEKAKYDDKYNLKIQKTNNLVIKNCINQLVLKKMAHGQEHIIIEKPTQSDHFTTPKLPESMREKQPINIEIFSKIHPNGRAKRNQARPISHTLFTPLDQHTEDGVYQCHHSRLNSQSKSLLGSNYIQYINNTLNNNSYVNATVLDGNYILFLKNTVIRPIKQKGHPYFFEVAKDRLRDNTMQNSLRVNRGKAENLLFPYLCPTIPKMVSKDSANKIKEKSQMQHLIIDICSSTNQLLILYYPTEFGMQAKIKRSNPIQVFEVFKIDSTLPFPVQIIDKEEIISILDYYLKLITHDFIKMGQTSKTTLPLKIHKIYFEE